MEKFPKSYKKWKIPLFIKTIVCETQSKFSYFFSLFVRFCQTWGSFTQPADLQTATILKNKYEALLCFFWKPFVKHFYLHFILLSSSFIQHLYSVSDNFFLVSWICSCFLFSFTVFDFLLCVLPFLI